MIQRSVRIYGSGFPRRPLDKNLLPSFNYFSGGPEFIKPGNNVESNDIPTYRGKKNKMKETSIMVAKLPLD